MYDIDVSILAQYKGGQKERVRITGIEKSEGDRDGIELRFIFDSGRECVFFSDTSVFDALRSARLQFEVDGIVLLCRGSAKNVYPSPMQQSMGLSTLAYRTSIGSQAKSADIVDMFDSESETSCSTVAEQEAFHNEWLCSLG